MSIGNETMRVLIGNRVWLASNGVNFLDAEDEISSHEAQGRTVVLMALNGVFTGWFAVEDTLKDDSAYAIKALQSMGIMVVVLTGDNKKTAAALIGPLGAGFLRLPLLSNCLLFVCWPVRVLALLSHLKVSAEFVV